MLFFPGPTQVFNPPDHHWVAKQIPFLLRMGQAAIPERKHKDVNPSESYFVWKPENKFPDVATQTLSIWKPDQTHLKKIFWSSGHRFVKTFQFDHISFKRMHVN